MKISLVAINDWSNVGYELSESLRSIGVDAKMFIKNKHPFNYPKQGEPFDNKFIEDSDCIIFMHSQCIKINTEGKKTAVFHGGSAYRVNHEEINKFFGNIDVSFLQHPNFLEYNPKNPLWLLPPVTNSIETLIEQREKPIIGHFPRFPKEKGFHRINTAMNWLHNDIKYTNKFIYRTGIGHIPWEDNIKRMQDCNIYIEQLYKGEFGITALEAAACGNIVVTNFDFEKEYKKEYGELGIIIANDEMEIRDRVKELLDKKPKEIIDLQVKSNEWVRKNHSYEATGKKILEALK